MKYLFLFVPAAMLLLGHTASAQVAGKLAGTPVEASAGGSAAKYLFTEYYPGTIRTSDDQVHDGIPLRYDLAKDEVEYKSDSGVFRLSAGVTEFSIPTGTDLYTFKNGYPAADGQSDKSFYRLLYDGNTKLLKKYTQPIVVEKASATTTLEPDAKLYILKNDKLNPVQLNNKNSFLKLLQDEKNKMQYVIKEQQLEFGAEDDLERLLEEYDSYRAGRGGN